MANSRHTLGGNATPVTIIGGESSGDPVNVTIAGGDSSGTPVPITDSTWTLSLQAEETADDSDKTFVVPAGVDWQIMWIWVEYTSTGTAGNRQLELRILDSSDDVLFAFRTGLVQAATLTYNYLLAPGMSDLTAVRSSTYVTSPIPPSLFVPSGYKVNIRDSAAIAAAADDMIVQMMVATRSV